MKNKPMKYGLRAYGTETRFASKAAFKRYLLEWMANTDGAERTRAVDALLNLEAGIPFTNTDIRDYANA